MLRDIATRMMLAKADKFGRDEHGNYIISQESMKELATEMATELSKSVKYPVVTTTFRDVLTLAQAAGLRPANVTADGLQTTIILDASERFDMTQQASALVDHTTRFVLGKVREFSDMQGDGNVDQG